MISIFVKADVFVVGRQTINLMFFNENDVVDQWTSTGQMINPLVVLGVQYLDILLVIRQYSQIVATFKLEQPLSLQLH